MAITLEEMRAELGPPHAHYASFLGFGDAEILGEDGEMPSHVEPGSAVTAFHGQLFPGAEYPSDKEAFGSVRAGQLATADFFKAERNIYRRKIDAYQAAGIIMQRLIVLHGPDKVIDPRYDPDMHQLIKDIWAPVEAAELESIRLAWFVPQMLRLDAGGYRDHAITQLYERGATETKSGPDFFGPKASLWALLSKRPDEQSRIVRTVGLMNYTGEQFAGVSTWRESNGGIPASLMAWVGRWLTTYNRYNESIPLQESVVVR